MQIVETSIIGSNNLPISIDYRFTKGKNKKSVVIFCHGFKGFKNWGAWDLVADEFANEDFIFLKFNFSHNGTTIDNPVDFKNINAFSENNYTKELEDLQMVIDWVFSSNFPAKDSHNTKVFLIGHSRGGACALVKSNEEDRVLKTTTWASVDSYNRFGTKEQIIKWEKDGVHNFINGRTGQNMPIKFQFYSDYINNKSRLDIENSVKTCQKPLLIIHGNNDPAVNIESARNLFSWSKNSKIIELEGADHVFGSKHPYLSDSLPSDLKKVVSETINFFKK